MQWPTWGRVRSGLVLWVQVLVMVAVVVVLVLLLVLRTAVAKQVQDRPAQARHASTGGGFGAVDLRTMLMACTSVTRARCRPRV